ncbi:cytochrome c oxidase subunit 4 isoform 1, mitochondrial-like [Mya arenaria]|uniref:cytochrome c oxidase subunit 4 isoform 1, mitochondrial-like n=1 Tax=Mya arenaria TaxID=6604 RepID=UPI0022E5A50B|nr:cytochrome c oxidase subunit 4 isoform 1, mitochondrial-like [Mya arenaria]
MWARLPSQSLSHVNKRALSLSVAKATTAVHDVAPKSRLEVMQELSKNNFQPDPTKIPQSLKDLRYPAIGNRDVVGPSLWINHDYHDVVDQPYPAVRFAENTPAVLALREKETGDWTKLTLEEKKQIYRNSFRMTFAEMEAPTGDYKRIAFHCLYLFAAVTLYQYYVNTQLFDQENAPKLERQQVFLKEMVMIGANPISGVSSKYDYENNQWRK